MQTRMRVTYGNKTAKICINISPSLQPPRKFRRKTRKLFSQSRRKSMPLPANRGDERSPNHLDGTCVVLNSSACWARSEFLVTSCFAVLRGKYRLVPSWAKKIPFYKSRNVITRAGILILGLMSLSCLEKSETFS